jgi:hypothetical protein
MREITSHKVNGLNEALTIRVMDEPGCGGASHHYLISHQAPQRPDGETVGHDIFFQNGPIKEAGVNGISQEALLAIVADRLEGFQAGQFANPDNAEALTHVRMAIEILHRRTKERLARGVEGTLQK